MHALSHYLPWFFNCSWPHTCYLLLVCCTAGNAHADLELQPNAGAPLLRTEKARREWVEQELELCSTSWQYQKVRAGSL
jgi:hypothetical protein